ncbi:hypothetical protein D3C71_1788960 [compost metagenome]
MLKVIASHDKFDLKIDSEQKVFSAEVRGYFNEQDGLASLEGYNLVISKINPSEYTLLLNCELLETSSPEMADVLKNCFIMYKHQGFKKIELLETTSKIAMKQIKKIIKDVGVEVEIIGRV